MIEQPLKILVLGAGAIGIYIGTSLIKSGQGAVFLDRPESAKDLLAHGLRLKFGSAEFVNEHPSIESTIEEALAHGPFDACIAAVKSFDTEELAKSLSPFRTELPPLVCFQNGVENEDIYRSYLGSDKVIAGTLTSAIGKYGTGAVVVEKFRGTGIALTHEISGRLVAGFDKAGLNCTGYKNEAAMKWSKMLTNLVANASSAVLNLTPREIFVDKHLFRIEALQMAEIRKVMTKLNIPIVDLPGTPVKMLVNLFRYVPEWAARPLTIKFIASGRGNKMPSFYIDLRERKAPVEIDFLNGAVVRFGEKAGVPTPINRFLNQTLQMLSSGSLPIDYYDKDPQKFLKDLLKSEHKKKI